MGRIESNRGKLNDVFALVVSDASASEPMEDPTEMEDMATDVSEDEDDYALPDGCFRRISLNFFGKIVRGNSSVSARQIGVSSCRES